MIFPFCDDSGRDILTRRVIQRRMRLPMVPKERRGERKRERDLSAERFFALCAIVRVAPFCSRIMWREKCVDWYNSLGFVKLGIRAGGCERSKHRNS